MKFESIKARAAAFFTRQVAEEIATVGITDRQQRLLSFAALAADLTMTESARVATLKAAQAEGLKRIDRWDVRQVASLLEAFPEAAPTMVGKRLNCRVADNEECDMLVELAS